MRDQKTKEAFIKYLQDPKNKDLRFWQAIREFWEIPYVLISNHRFGRGQDTFYIEADEERKV